MGNIFKSSSTPRNQQSHHEPQTSIDPASLKPTLFIPVDKDLNQAEEYRIRFYVRHTASDCPVAIVEAHKDHTVAQLKRHLIELMGMPFPSEDGRCKISAVWTKPGLIPDEPLKNDDEKNTPKIDRRFLGGSIDHLTLSEYGLGNGDKLTFIVTFSQIHRASAKE